MSYFLRTSVRPSLSLEGNTEARLEGEDLGVDFDLGELTHPLEADPPALSSTLHPLSALPSVYPTTITTSTGSVNPSYNTPASNVPSPPNSISPPAGSVDPLSDTPTSIPTSTVPSTSNPTVEFPAASNKCKNARSHDKRAKIRRIRKEEKAGPSSNTYANVLSHGTAIEVEADATHFSAAKGAVIIWTRFPLRLNFYLPINTPIVAGNLYLIIRNATTAPKDFDFIALIDNSLWDHANVHLEDEGLGVEFELDEHFAHNAFEGAQEFHPETRRATLCPGDFDFLDLIRNSIKRTEQACLEDEDLGAVSEGGELDGVDEGDGEEGLTFYQLSHLYPPSRFLCLFCPLRQCSPWFLVAFPSFCAARADAEPAQTAGHKHKNGQKHEKQRVERAKDRATREGPSAATLSHVLSPGTAVEVELDAAEFDAAKGAQTGSPGTHKKLGN
ncbi:hypothetical protein BT96DRAFT_1007366 [Gymnopus androsaceus JB14]|uniref:Uncharacterized protein n=1 Tax=Gymnopus androsaceus JB14 TaxID=1447944 RepID=A0A6A4GHJ8_9AGAR|nr:hypothetical protein BT96DRAFT_1007366 [Gymnopus androsaceus JB14]